MSTTTIENLLTRQRLERNLTSVVGLLVIAGFVTLAVRILW